MGINNFLYKRSFAVPSHHLSPCLLYLTCRSVALPSPLSYTFLISAFSVNKDSLFSWLLLPKTLSLALICVSIPLRCSSPLSIIHSVHVSLSVSHFLPFTPHSLPHPFPLFPQPTASLSSGRGEQCRPTWGPAQSQPRRQGAPENTHNSMFRTGLRDKGKPHTWLTMWVSLGSFVEAEGSNWHQNPPLRVCIYVCEKSVSCPLTA